MIRSKLGNTYDKETIIANDSTTHNTLKQLYTGKECNDCKAKPANWATLKRGVFICINCAQTLRADSDNKIKSCMGTYLWCPDELEKMKEKNQK